MIFYIKDYKKRDGRDASRRDGRDAMPCSRDASRSPEHKFGRDARDWCRSPNTHRAMEIDYDGLREAMAAIIQKKPLRDIVNDYDDALDLLEDPTVIGAGQAWEAAVLVMSAVKLAHDRKSGAG